MLATGSHNILFVSAEVAPLAKVGGLGDVSGSLPKALRQLGHDVRVIMPYYGTINQERYQIHDLALEHTIAVRGVETSFRIKMTTIDDVPIYLIDQPHYYGRHAVYGFSDDSERFAFFCRAVLEAVRLLGWKPDILHCNDWHTGLIPLWLRTAYAGDPLYAGIATLYTLHILAYQGSFAHSILDAFGMGTTVPADDSDMVNPMEQGIRHADLINTVSETYASEILTPECGEGLDPLLNQRKDDLSGILNGIDYDCYNPASDPEIAANYDVFNHDAKQQNKFALQHEFHLPAAPTTPLVGLVSRLAELKGFDLIMQVLEQVLPELDIQVVLLGSGDQHYQDFFRSLAMRYPNKIGIAIGFNAALAERIYAGSDMFLMPSRTEPCGLGQLIALRYGSIPIVRHTGGLADTIQNYEPETQLGNGFNFTHYTPFALSSTLIRAIETYRYREIWQALVTRAMLGDYSWRTSARKYSELYIRVLSKLDHGYSVAFAS